MFSPQPWGAESAQAVVQQRRRSETCSWEMQAGAGHTWEGGAHVGRRDEEENKGQREIKKKKMQLKVLLVSVKSRQSPDYKASILRQAARKNKSDRQPGAQLLPHAVCRRQGNHVDVVHSNPQWRQGISHRMCGPCCPSKPMASGSKASVPCRQQKGRKSSWSWSMQAEETALTLC